MTSTIFQVATVVLDQIFDGNFTVISSAISFATSVTPVAELSQPQTEQSDYAGLLYTPSIGTRCTDTQATIARNLTFLDLPSSKILIALAPSSNCRTIYLSQAVQDGAKALILYPPSYDISPIIPPNDPTYNAAIPVYFATWNDAAPIATAMNEYNTDLLHVPYGQNLSGSFPSGDYVRLLISVNKTGSSPRSLPGLWIFLLIVLGLLCFIVAATSIAMHTHQYIARRDLRRRIASGEVDLEGLGIKRLTVPKKHVDSLPRTLWQVDGTVPTDTAKQSSTAQPGSNYNQTNCAICLEDYEHNISAVRELPCRHIYHQDCIDSFLLTRSSLCPLCKQSVLPKGYIPPDSLLTSATVMRERRRRRQEMRRLRESNEPVDLESPQTIRLESTSRQQVANVADLAPNNEEEAEAQLRGSAPRRSIKRLWNALFPS